MSSTPTAEPATAHVADDAVIFAQRSQPLHEGITDTLGVRGQTFFVEVHAERRVPRRWRPDCRRSFAERRRARDPRFLSDRRRPTAATAAQRLAEHDHVGLETFVLEAMRSCRCGRGRPSLHRRRHECRACGSDLEAPSGNPAAARSIRHPTSAARGTRPRPDAMGRWSRTDSPATSALHRR